MNKVKLIKSFAGLPKGEYMTDGRDYYYQINVDSNAVTIHKDIVEGMKDHFEEVKERPTSWEELGEVNGYFINDDCEIKKANNFYTSYNDASNVYLTKEQAEASIALAQITQLLVAYDIPEENIKRYTSEGFVYDGCSNKKRKGLLRFDTKEKKDHFYKHHKTLIDKLAPFYIF